MRRQIIILLAASFLFSLACTCSLEEAEKLVGACEKQKEIIQGPPKTIFIKMPQISAPTPLALQSEAWTEEQIREDPVGFEEALINDLLQQTDLNVSLIEYIERLEVQRKRLEAAANSPEHQPE